MTLLPFLFQSPGAVGFTLSDDGNGRCSVSSLDDDPQGGKGMAERLGIKTGDVLAYINETLVEGVSFRSVINIIKEARFPLRFTMMRAEEGPHLLR